MQLFLLSLFLLIGMVLHPGISWAQFEVLEIALAGSVQDRQPANPFSPPAYCERDKNGQAAIPVIDASDVQQVYFWTKVAASTEGGIRHTWHLQTEEGWERISEVDLSIAPSAGYRTWSSKSLLPDYHLGEWMIVVSPANDPDTVLCITRFTVK